MIALQLINSFKHGGAENVAYNYSLVLRELGYRSIMVARKDSDEYEKMISDSGIECVYSMDRNLFHNIDIVFVHSNQNLLKLVKYNDVLRINKTRIIYVQHLNYSEFKFRLLSKLINFVCTDYIQITPITRDKIDRYINIPVHFIVNFYINKYSVEQYMEIRQSIRSELNVSDDITLIMYSAVFKPGKGLADFLDLAVRFKDCAIYKFLVVGDGPESQLIEQYSVGNIIWIGFVNDVEKYLLAADIYVFTSVFKHEMMPMALLEAINCNKPILAYDFELTNFCLNNLTFCSLDYMEVTIRNREVPVGFKKYDMEYALNEFKNLLS